MKLTDRFWSKVRKGDGCWDWLAYKHQGRGMFRVGEKMCYAPRVSWELTYGPLSDGQKVLHRCDNPSCVRPDHLFIGTQVDNMLDMKMKGRSNRPIGESNGRCETSEEFVRKVKELFNQGMKPPEISRLTGINYRRVRSITSGQTWKHIVI